MNRHCRRGVISLSFLLVVLALVVLLVSVWNIFAKTSQKLEAQNRADASANAAAVAAARAMNQITLVNHLIGELNAVSALVMAYCGLELESGTGFDLTVSNYDSAYSQALIAGSLAGIPPDAEAYRLAQGTRSASGGAIGNGRRTLKGLLTASFQRHASAPAAELQEQRAIAAEWKRLDALEARVKSELLPLKQRCNHWLIPGLAAHARQVVAEAPARMQQAFHAAGDHDAISSYSLPFELPVESEQSFIGKNSWEYSQFVRATTPFVQYWRQPILAYAAKQLPRSGFAEFYRQWSQSFTLELSRWQARDFQTYLFILKDHAKYPGDEPWATRAGSPRRDDLFSVLAVSHTGDRPYRGGLLVPTRASLGTLAMTQAMLVNDIPPPNRTAPWQRGFGWDTLNWNPQDRIPEFSRGQQMQSEPLDAPRFDVHWQTRLMPVTRWPQPGEIPGDAGRLLETLNPPDWLKNLH